MRDYIENWLKKASTKISEPDQAKVVTTDHGIPSKENTKGTSMNRRQREKPITISKVVTFHNSWSFILLVQKSSIFVFSFLESP
jgi:protoheme ferro-lyase